MACLPGVGEGPLVGLHLGRHLPARERHVRQCGIRDVEGQVVASGLEHWQRLLDELGQLLRSALGLELDAGDARPDLPTELGDTIVRRRGSLGEGICAPERIVGPPCPDQGFAKLGFKEHVELGRRDQGGGALEQADRGAVVLTQGGAVAGSRQAPTRLGSGSRWRSPLG